ncbi:DUF4124 domain-containing protein [Hydrogenophaga sp.]|uniref:DUF4124 domain-containing protein n=1 Tax=Hydrogenophaga sp. TaxID=1904254 RepID=UPI00356A709E
MDKRRSTALHWRAPLLAALTALACSAALAQWQWVDNTGRKVFSDTPPPPGVPEKNIVKRPYARSAAPAASSPASTSATVPATTSATAPVLSGKDEQLELKKKQAEEAELAKKKEEAAQQAKAQAENCDRAKRAKATLDSGIRIATTNAKGEREIMDDKARADEGKRLNEVVRADCNPPQVN